MRQEAALRRTAWIVVTIMNYAGKQLQKGKTVNVDDLIKKTGQPKDPDLVRRQLVRRHRLSERFGITTN